MQISGDQAKNTEQLFMTLHGYAKLGIDQVYVLSLMWSTNVFIKRRYALEAGMFEMLVQYFMGFVPQQGGGEVSSGRRWSKVCHRDSVIF